MTQNEGMAGYHQIAMLRVRSRGKGRGDEGPRGFPPGLAGIGLGAGGSVGGNSGRAGQAAQRRLVNGRDQAVVVAALWVYCARFLQRWRGATRGTQTDADSSGCANLTAPSSTR